MSSSFTVRTLRGVTLVDLAGRLTLGPGLVELEDLVSQSLASGVRQIIFNLQDVSYADSSGIGQLTGSLKAVTEKGGKLKLLKLSPRLEGLLLLTHVYSLFEVFTDEEKAIASFGNTNA